MFSTPAVPFPSPPAMRDSPRCSASSLTFGMLGLCNFSPSGGCTVARYYGLDLHFPGDW